MPEQPKPAFGEPEQQRLIPARKPGDILARAIAEHKPSQAYVLFSGGKDSSVTLDYLWRNHREVVTAALHINTGIGIPQTREFARAFCEERDIPFIEVHAERDYKGLVVEHGFPGPLAHRFMYVWLKERPLEKFIREHKTHRRDRIMLLTGVRAEESKRRMGTTREINRDGCQVWVAPLIDWSNADMWRYREKYGVEMSEPSKTIHLSGECLCGAFADEDEMRMLEIFYPEVAERIRGIEAAVKAAGQTRCEWGKKYGEQQPTQAPGPMCVGCTSQIALIESEDVA